MRPFQPWPEPTVFATIPRLPVVPLPREDEDLASWLRAVAATYGMTPGEYLAHLGFPPRRVTPRTEMGMVLRPPPLLLRRLSVDTGLHPGRLRAMTLAGAEPLLASAARDLRAPCPDCAAAAGAGSGRPVSLLGAWAAWRVVCPRHPPFPGAWEVSPGVDLAAVYSKVRDVLSVLDWAAFDPTALAAPMPLVYPAVTAGAVVHFASQLNSFLRVRLESFDSLWEAAVFRVVTAQAPGDDGPASPLPGDCRNDRALSLLLAWQLLSDPPWALLMGLRIDHGPGGLPQGEIRAVYDLLMEAWPDDALDVFILGHKRHAAAWGHQAGGYTRLAAALAAARGNQPGHDGLVRLASEQHTVFFRHLFSAEVAGRRPGGRTRFDLNGSLGHGVPPAIGMGAKLAAAVRRKVRQYRGWDAKLARLAAPLVASHRDKQPAAPLSITPLPQMLEVARRILQDAGQPPVRMTARERQRHLGRLARSALWLRAPQP